MAFVVIWVHALLAVLFSRVGSVPVCTELSYLAEFSSGRVQCLFPLEFGFWVGLVLIV